MARDASARNVECYHVEASDAAAMRKRRGMELCDRCKRRRIELCYRCSPYGILPRVKTRDVPTAPLIILNNRLQVHELGPEAFTALLGVATDPHPVFYSVL